MDFGTEKVNLKKHGAATLTYQKEGTPENSSQLMMTSNSRRTRVLIYSGAPIKEDIVQYGPFVMNSMEEIKEAYRDFHNGKFGPPAV